MILAGMFARDGGGGGGGGSVAHQHWRIIFDANDGSTLYDGIEELSFFATVGSMTDLTTPAEAYTAAVASSEINGLNTARMAFDDSFDGRWLSASAGGSWLRYDFAAPVSVAEISIVGPRTTLSSSPKDFRLQSADDPSGPWTTELTVTGQTGWGTSEFRRFAL